MRVTSFGGGATLTGVSGGAANAADPAASTDAPRNLRLSITATLALLRSLAALVFRVVPQIVLALEARVLHLLVRVAIGHLPAVSVIAADVPVGRPRLRIDAGIGDRNLVNDSVRVLRNELLGHMQRFRLEVTGRIEPGFRVLIRRIDHQRVAFPV